MWFDRLTTPRKLEGRSNALMLHCRELKDVCGEGHTVEIMEGRQ